MKFTIHYCTCTYTCARTHRSQDSLPGTRQQWVAKWDVWEPPAAKRRTGRRNKPSLMETWHAHWGGNSNKRLMGHGAFSIAAKYPPLLQPPSVLSLCSRAPRWPTVRHFPTHYPKVTYFCCPSCSEIPEHSNTMSIRPTSFLCVKVDLKAFQLC